LSPKRHGKTKNKENQSNSSRQIQKQTQENAENNPATTKTNTIPIEIPQPFDNTWSPCASSRGVKLLISTTCASHRTLKSGDFIGAYLQAQVIGRHFVRLPLEYAYYFPEYAKNFGTPSLLNKGIYGLVYFGKYWNIEFSEWLYAKGFIQPRAEPSYFVYHNKHDQWLRLLFLSTTCSMLAAMMPSKKNSKTLYTIALMLDFLDLQNGSYKCVSTSTKTKATPLINIATFLTPYNVTIQTRNSLNVPT
jgi:hypothetical protein